MIKRVSDKVWKLEVDSNLYFLDLDEKIIIDTGRRANHAMVELFLSKVIPLQNISKVIFTHLHYDHIGNFDLFKNAEFFASKAEIDDFKRNPVETILDKDMAGKFNIELKPISQIKGLKIIETPGHTRGSICILYEANQVLFSGDMLLKKGCGRTDLPTSAPDRLQESINKLLALKYRILCPGHDY